MPGLRVKERAIVRNSSDCFMGGFFSWTLIYYRGFSRRTPASRGLQRRHWAAPLPRFLSSLWKIEGVSGDASAASSHTGHVNFHSSPRGSASCPCSAALELRLMDSMNWSYCCRLWCSDSVYMVSSCFGVYPWMMDIRLSYVWPSSFSFRWLYELGDFISCISEMGNWSSECYVTYQKWQSLGWIQGMNTWCLILQLTLPASQLVRKEKYWVVKLPASVSDRNRWEWCITYPAD